MTRRAGMTIPEVIFVLAVIALLIAILLPAMGSPHRHHNPMHNGSQLRGVHQSMVVFSNSNGHWLPGLDGNGQILPNGEGTGFSGPGSVASAQFWILVNGQFIASDLLQNPQETLTRFTTGRLTIANHSYAASKFTPDPAHAGRLAEWRDNANGQAVLIGDRNTGPTAAKPRSVWTRSDGDWKGSLVWGDNHAEFAQTCDSYTTRYESTTNTSDHLFRSESATGHDALVVHD